MWITQCAVSVGNTLSMGGEGERGVKAKAAGLLDRVERDVVEKWRMYKERRAWVKSQGVLS